MGQAHLVAVGGAGVTDADGFGGATLGLLHRYVLLPRVVCRGQPKNATAGVKAVKCGFQFSVFGFRLKKTGTWYLVATYTCWCFLYGLYA